MSEWRECELGEIINLKRGHDLPKRLRQDGNIPIISSSGVSGFHNTSKADAIGVVTGRYGTIGKVFLSKVPFWPLNTTLYVENFKGNDEIFIYYFLQKIDWEIFNDKSAVPGVNRNDVHKENILTPPLPEQKAIAEVLSVLDDKIDLLHRQNKTLEQMAETLFRQWFMVEPGEDWEEGVLSDLVEVKYGKDHKKLQDGEIPVYGSGGVMRYAEKSLYDDESVLIPRKGTLNNVVYIDEPFWTVDTMFYTIMKQPNIAKFIYQFMKEKDLASMNVGSAVPSMTTQVLNSMPLLIPSDNEFEYFENAVIPYYQKTKENQKQIRTLQSLRDTLLPKLMSGGIRVKI